MGHQMRGWADAGEDRRSGGLSVTSISVGPGAAGSPTAPDPDDRRRRSERAVGRVRGAVSPLGRPSIAPERLLRALLLQAFCSVRSERLLMEQLDYNLLYRWFVGLGIDDPVWHPTAFTTNRERLLEGEVAGRFLTAVLDRPEVKRLLSDDHFSVDGTLVEAWASMKSFRPKDGPDDEPPAGGRHGERDFHGERRRKREPCLAHRPGGAAVSQGHGQGGQAQLHRSV